MECNHDYFVIDGHYTCVLCGSVDIDRIAFHESIHKPICKSYYIYHRKSYFREKFRFLIGIKQPPNQQEYQEVIEKIKQHPFETIFDLKRLMRKLKLSLYYKYIYHIYFLIKNIKLIPLTLIEIDNLVNKFLALERSFKQQLPGKNNLPSYDIVISVLLKKNHYNCYKHVLQPKNQRKLTKIIEKFSEVV